MMDSYCAFVKAKLVLLLIDFYFLQQRVVIILILVELMKGIGGGGSASCPRIFLFLKSGIRILDILYGMYAVFLPALKNPVSVFKTVLVRGDDAAFTGLQNNIQRKTVFPEPFLDAGGFLFVGAPVLPRAFMTV